jgi:HEPN domain-containing protein
MNRSDLQIIAEMRVEDARTLLAAGRYDGAYYLAGYAVECALKACIAKQIRQYDFPDKKVVLDSYVHDLTKLVGVSGIKHVMAAELQANKAFEANWTIVKDWSEEARYEHMRSEQEARDLFTAVTDANSGVLTWLKTQW